ncbi:MAG: hypothetical protein L6R36_006790 [Xanthoria steineri]|nr:MAG: hypothetical protein L6R36_006790 [Xanthoria steineri]
MSLDYTKPALTRIRPDIEGHGYDWNYVEPFGTFSKNPVTGQETEETAYVNMTRGRRGEFPGHGRGENLPYSEIIYQTWQFVRQRDDFFKTVDPNHPGGGPISTIQAMVQIDVENKETQEVLRTIWTVAHLDWNEGDANWYRFTVTQTPDWFYALLGTVNVKGAVFLLKDHAAEIGKKTITEIYVRVNPDIWIAMGPNTPVAGAISTS